MDWFACSSDILTDPKVARFAVALGVAREAAVGHLVGIYGGLAKHGDEHGDLSTITDDVLEDWARYRGEPQAFARAFREHFQDADGCLHNWQARNGGNIRRARAERDRKRAERASKGSRPADRPQDSPQDRAQDRTQDRTQERRAHKTRQDKTTTTTDSTGAPWVEPARAIWLQHVGVVKRATVKDTLGDVVKAIGDEAMLKALVKFVEHRARIVARGETDFIPGLAAFARDFRSFMPVVPKAAA